MPQEKGTAVATNLFCLGLYAVAVVGLAHSGQVTELLFWWRFDDKILKWQKLFTSTFAKLKKIVDASCLSFDKLPHVRKYGAYK